MLQGEQEVLVHPLRLLIPGGTQPLLCFEALPLIERVVQLAERVGKLHSADEQLEALHDPFFPSLHLCQWGDLDRVVLDDRRLNQRWLHETIE